MKKLITIILLLAIMPMVLPTIASADEPDNTFFNLLLKKQPKDDSGNEVDPDDETHRIPGRPIVCTISAVGGIQCAIDKNDILSYELWDAEGEMLIASYVDEMDFVTNIFALSEGIFLLKIVTADYQYIGELSTY